MSDYLISVVVPAFNASEFIAEALDGVLHQHYPPQEVVVVNDGSVDATESVVRQWIAHNQPGFQVVVVNQENHGIARSRNVGMWQAQHPWIAFLDADDIWEDNHLAELVAGLSVAKGAVAAYGAGRLLHKGVVSENRYDDFWDNPSQTYGKQIDNTRFLLMDRAIYQRLLVGNFIKPTSLIFSKSAALEVGLINENLKVAEDREFLLRLIRRGEFVYSPEVISQYRWHDDNATQTKNAVRNFENSMLVYELISHDQSTTLTVAEKGALQGAIKNSSLNYLYTRSLNGFMSYCQGVHFIGQKFGWLAAILALRPSHIARSWVRIFS